MSGAVDVETRSGGWRTLGLFAGLVVLVALLVWPSLAGRVQYARTRAELRAIRDAAKVAELTSVGKLFTTLARLIGPAVVNVTSTRRFTTVVDEIAALSGESTRGVTGENVGSGVIIGEDGVVVTNNHVVARSDAITVRLADGRRFKADLVGADAAADLAVLKIEAAGLPVAAWGDSDAVEVGEMVWALGSPFGLDRTLTYGIVSAVGRRGLMESPYQEFLQTDASINPGNSGGPLVDVHGHVVGITTAIVGRDYSGIGFAIPSNTAREVCAEILAEENVDGGYLGMALRELPSDAALASGAVVMAVEPGSPAALAGLAPGDVVTAFDDDPVEEPAVLVLMLTRAAIGDRVPIDFVRDGEARRVDVLIGRRPLDQ